MKPHWAVEGYRKGDQGIRKSEVARKALLFPSASIRIIAQVIGRDENMGKLKSSEYCANEVRNTTENQVEHLVPP